MVNVIERPTCRLRYQQSPVDVYAHFMANDHDSGRVTYLVNRRTWLRVTDLVLPLLRVSDPRIASLRGRILQGRSMGRTEVQVTSHFKVTLTKMLFHFFKSGSLAHHGTRNRCKRNKSGKR